MSTMSLTDARSLPRPALAERGRILVADDQPAVREALWLLLKPHGYQVRAVASPAAVLEALAEPGERYDLLVMDLNYARDTTTGQEGLELVAAVQAVDPQLPIVVMTAWSTVPLAVATMREGVYDFIEKPWDNARVLASVAAHVTAGDRRRRTQRLEADALAVQRRLLAGAVPRVEGFDIGVAWNFAEPLGGDAYVAARRPDGRLAVAIADVCGKGMPAALLMASTLATLEDLVEAPLSPAQFCAQLSRILAPRLGDERFVSLAFAVLDPASGCLTYANAGHPAPLLLHADGRTSRLTAGGPVLGVVAEATYEEGRLPLGAGDRLALFTDGVSEATSASGEELGEARLLGRLQERCGRSAADASAGVLDLARDFAGGALADDATVVVVDTLVSGAMATRGPQLKKERA
jgi:sigma-B regulation protein RsbU (phosphoserine phosphatase)